MKIPFPDGAVFKIYDEATKHFQQLQANPNSKAAVRELDKLNGQIKKHNQETHLEPDQCVIDYEPIIKEYKESTPTVNRLIQNPDDQEAVRQLQECNKLLIEFCDKWYYRQWIIKMDTIRSLKARSPKRRGASAQTVQPTTAPPVTAPPITAPPVTAPPVTAPPVTAPPVTAPPVTAPPVTAPPVTAQPVTAQPVTAQPTLAHLTGQPIGQPVQPAPTQTLNPSQPTKELPEAVKNVQSEVLGHWEKMGWSTYRTSDGDTILSYKALSREGKDPDAYEFTVMMEESPYFTIKMGSEIGRENTKSYLALPNIYRRQTDPGEEGTPVYTFRDKDKYVRLLFTATKQRKQTRVGVKPRTGDTQCAVLWRDGKVSEMARAHFRKVTTEDEKRAIEKCCKSIGAPLPWDIIPKAIIVPTDIDMGRDLLHGGLTGSLINFKSSAISTAPQDAALLGIVTSLQNSMASLHASLQAMQNQQALQMEMLMLMRQQQEQTQRDRTEQLKFNDQLLQTLRNVNPLPPNPASN